MKKKHLVGRQPFVTQKCLICGRTLSEKHSGEPIGDRCFKAAKKIAPDIFDLSGKVVKDRITEDVRLAITTFMLQGSR